MHFLIRMSGKCRDAERVGELLTACHHPLMICWPKNKNSFQEQKTEMDEDVRG